MKGFILQKLSNDRVKRILSFGTRKLLFLYFQEDSVIISKNYHVLKNLDKIQMNPYRVQTIQNNKILIHDQLKT